MNSTNPPTVLLVDDRPATRYATSRVLQNAGFRTIEAVTGAEALQVVSPECDLVVLDVNLPDLDGHEVCRRIRQRPEVARVPVIHLSATFVSDDHKIRGLEAGADGYLTHPVDPLVLVATIKAFIRARMMEGELLRSEAKFRAVFDHALTGICLITNDMIYLDVNPALCRILKREPHEIIGKHCSAFLRVGTESLIKQISEYLESHGTWYGNLPLLRGDGQVVELEWNVSIHSAPNIRLAVITDVTERQRETAERDQLLESERAARAAAENANRLKDDFLATLSHELRTPLNAIVGWAEVLQMRTPSKAELAEGLATIERNAKGQAELINDLLDVSSIISGKLRLKLQSVDPRTIIRHALAAVMPAAQAQGIVITEHLPPTCEPVRCDPSRLQQVIWNLVNNAVKFTPKGGQVGVELIRTSDSVEISVSDTGKGIKPEFLAHIFERFRQEDASSTRTYGGLGLGLAIVRHLVELHGGTVSAQSQGEGCGSKFIVRLPQSIPDDHSEPMIESPAPAATTSPRAATTSRHAVEIGPDIKGVRVLIIDDDRDARVAAVRFLKECEADVADADSAASALMALESFRPQVLVSDIGMPKMDGYGLIREVRRRGFDSQSLPAIAVTAFTRPEDRERVLREGYQAHLGKPYSPTELVALIATVLARRSP